jgi:hypothetical protein
MLTSARTKKNHNGNLLGPSSRGCPGQELGVAEKHYNYEFYPKPEMSTFRSDCELAAHCSYMSAV